MAPITIEEENFLRIVQLIFGVVVEAVRTVFDKFFPPMTLHHTLQANKKDVKDLEKKQILRKPQMDVLFSTTGVPSSKNFDITLMMCLLKNLKQVPPQSLKMNLVPPSSDKSEGADLVRLRLHRNTIGHIESNTIDAHIFKTMWADITQAVLRLGGSKYQQKCDDIRKMIFDTTIISIIQQEVQAFKRIFIDELRDMNQRVLDIEQQMDSQTTSDIHKVMIEKWEYDDRTFVHTNAIKHIMSLIEDEHCILIKGNPGSGRSVTIRHIALKLRDRQCKHEYEIVFCRESKDIEKNYKAKAYQVFVCDDTCGEYTIDHREVNRWSSKLTRDIFTTIFSRGKSKLLLSVQNQVFQESLFSELNYLKFALIDMSDEKFVTLDQKCQIAKQLLSNGDEDDVYLIDYGRQMNILRNIEFAPLTFSIENDDCNENIPLFYTDPIETYSKELNALNNAEDKSKLSNTDLQDMDGKSALYHACAWKYNRAVNILTEFGANVNLEAKDKSTPLMEACFMEDEDTLHALMEKPSGPYRPIIEQLLSKGADVNSTDENGWNAFGYSCETGNIDMIRRLIEFTNNVNNTYRNGKTPLQMATESGSSN
ncbi:uncharacterized protein LOC143074036 [Mytilus galloprovincialis]|uniref:uncharacterized protein LOC143074036 n=1 Tax=Mytilus galloprovincialis TaxID=29158 RepID=UPI003F7C802F